MRAHSTCYIFSETQGTLGNKAESYCGSKRFSVPYFVTRFDVFPHFSQKQSKGKLIFGTFV